MPEFDLADRLRKAMRVADVSVADMAAYLDVSRNSVGAWINGRTPPSSQTIRLWALRTGVPYEWLKTGIDPHPEGPDGGESVELPRVDSNHQPAGYLAGIPGYPTRRAA